MIMQINSFYTVKMFNKRLDNLKYFETINKPDISNVFYWRISGKVDHSCIWTFLFLFWLLYILGCKLSWWKKIQKRALDAKNSKWCFIFDYVFIIKCLSLLFFCLRLQKDKGSLTNLIVQNKQSSVTISIILSKNDLNKDWLLQWQKILIGYILDRKSNSRSEINFWLKQYPSLFSFAGSIPIYLYSKYNNVKIRTLFKRSFMKFEISKLLNYWFVILNIFNLSYPNQILTLFLVYMYWSYYKVNVIAWILLAICFLYFVI